MGRHPAFPLRSDHEVTRYCPPTPAVAAQVRLQAQASKHRYASALHAYTAIAHREGIHALWGGVQAAVARNAVGNACELAVADQVNQALQAHGGTTRAPSLTPSAACEIGLAHFCTLVA